MGNWRCVVKDQMQVLIRSGLYRASDRIFVNILGEEDCLSLFNFPKFRTRQNGKIHDFEFPTLRMLKRYCEHNNARIWYIHTKGVSRCSHELQKMVDWRKLMEYFTVENHISCARSLADHDICGVNWRTHREPHFAGNFWWANASYIRTLPDPYEFDVDDRWQAEWWIGRNPEVRPKSFHESGIKHYLSRYPLSRYAIQIPNRSAQSA